MARAEVGSRSAALQGVELRRHLQRDDLVQALRPHQGGDGAVEIGQLARGQHGQQFVVAEVFGIRLVGHRGQNSANVGRGETCPSSFRGVPTRPETGLGLGHGS
jgi:hypothetical protein